MTKKSFNKISKLLPVYILLSTYENWRNDRTLRLGAGIAYYGVFAIIPMITLMVGVAAYFYSTQDVKVFVSDAIVRVLGNDLSSSVSAIVEKLLTEEVQNTFTGVGVLGVVSLFITASFIFVAFQDALDAIWHNSVRLGLVKWIKRYVWAYIVVMLSSTLLFTAIFIRSAGSFLTSIFPGQFAFIEWFGNIAVTVTTWAVGILVLSLIYRMLIYEKIGWRLIIFASLIIAVLIYVGTWLLGIYISRYAANSLSGALGAVLLLLIWVYYESQIALAGAQFIKTLNENSSKLPAILKSK